MIGDKPAVWTVDAELRRTIDLQDGPALLRGIAALAVCVTAEPGETKWTVKRHGNVVRFRPWIRLSTGHDLWISAGYYPMPWWRFVVIRIRNLIGLGPKREPRIPAARVAP